jgi:hypothetical protein
MQPTERELLNEFLENFKLTFHDDWDYTRAMIRHEEVAEVTGDASTFLDPGVSDEALGWANRGALLDSYRELIAYLKENEPIPADF